MFRIISQAAATRRDGRMRPCAEFDATMLGLLGMSSGTYLGFKVPEDESPANSPGR